MTQFEFYKSFMFVAELAIAELLYVNKFRRRKLFVLRAAGGIIALFAFAFLFPVASENPFYCSFVFLSVFLASVLVCKLMFAEKWISIIFCTIAGYTTQHLAYELFNIIMSLLGASAAGNMYGSAAFAGIFENLYEVAIYAAVYTVTYFVAYLLFASRLKSGEPIRLGAKFFFILSIVLLMIDIFLNAVVVYNPVSGAELHAMIIGVYNIVCCIISLYLQFEVTLRKKVESTLDTVQQMWHKAKEQYAASKENIEYINMKCHDFKHQMHALRGGAVSDTLISDIEKRITIYDSSAQTGNDALDVVLTEKSLACNNNGIRLTIIADGKKLDFMAQEDIYALFGNILDNAIEAVHKLDESRRVISLHVKTIEGILIVRESNYYSGELRFENGLPVTTKTDKRYHGFGLKSIQYICGRYGGDLSIKTDGGVFDMSIMFFRSVPAGNRDA